MFRWVALGLCQSHMTAAQNCFAHCHKGIGVSETGRMLLFCHHSVKRGQQCRGWRFQSAHTVSLINVQISADPAFVIGMTLITFAFETSVTEIDVKAASRLTFHLVVSHVRDCKLNIAPAHTNVHSEPPMYSLYLSSER